MEFLIDKITSYLYYLNKDCHLSVSIHFDKSVFDCLPTQIVSRLLPFNSHTNPYCTVVKSTGHSKCLQEQKDLLTKCQKDAFLCHVCHAGVYEYTYPICKGTDTAGFIAVSGYRKELPKYCVNNDLWESALKDEDIPLNLCNALVPPLEIMFKQLLENFSTQNQTEYNLILQFLNEYHASINLADLSKQFSRSKSHISHLFKRESGMTLRAYCNNLKLEDAKNLLVNTNMSVTQIAYDTGFNDQSYFISLFRKKFGISPLQYRKQNR